jgi:hypothetical protein
VPQQILRDGRPWTEFSYDKAARRIMIRTGGDPRLHVLETVVRKQGIDLAGKTNVKIEEVDVVDTRRCSQSS